MESKEPDHEYTSTERIEQLNEIDRDVSKLLHAAGRAVQALTNTPLPTDSTKDIQSPEKSSLEAHQDAFKEACSQYFSLLSSIDVRLRRQVYALEEASIIRPDSTVKAGEGAGSSTFNPLETSWLNTRKDTVGKDKEAELWADAKEFVTRIESTSSLDSTKKQDGNLSSKQMEID